MLSVARAGDRTGGGYVDQSADALRLCVVEGRVDPARFTVVAHGVLRGPAVAVEARIIGASHLLTVSPAFGPPLCELLACTGLPARPPSLHPLLGGPLGELGELGERAAPRGPLSCETSGGLRYRFRAQRLPAPCAAGRLRALETRVRDAAGRAGQLGLAWSFPPSGSPSACGPAAGGRERGGRAGRLSPRTLVFVALDADGGVRAETAHCYPAAQHPGAGERSADADGVVVFSWSGATPAVPERAP